MKCDSIILGFNFKNTTEVEFEFLHWNTSQKQIKVTKNVLICFFRLNLEQCEVAVKILKTFFVMMIGYFIMESQLTATKINHKICTESKIEGMYFKIWTGFWGC